MKKILCSIVVICVYISFFSTPSALSADVYVPDEIFFGTSTVREAGSVTQMTFKESKNSIGRKNIIEYGIAKTIKQGLFTSFEIITTNTANITGFTHMPNLAVTVPNIAASAGGYVAYIKYSEKNNQDNTSFHVSKEFKISANTTAFTNIKYVSLLQSTGERFATIYGPTIYSKDHPLYNASLAVSTSLEITFESNTETTISPAIEFSKLRSNKFNTTFKPEPVQIHKGLTTVLIPLPVFNYESGVYIGKASFKSVAGEDIKNTVDLQYVIAGDSVSVGNVTVGSNAFNFEIFGTPRDMGFTSTSSTTTQPTIYSVTTDFLDTKGRIVHTSTQDVDFAKLSFTTAIVQHKFTAINVDRVHVKVLSPRTNKLAYEGTKPIQYTSPAQIDIKKIIYISLSIVLLGLLLLYIFKKNRKKIILCIVLLLILFLAQKVFGLTEALYPLDANRTSYKGTQSPYYDVIGQASVGHFPRIFFQGDIPNKVFTCGIPKTMTFSIKYIHCANTIPVLEIGASIVSEQDAVNTRVAVGLTAQESYANPIFNFFGFRTQEIHSATVYQYYYYTRLSEFKTLTIPDSPQNPQTLYMYAYHKQSADASEDYAGYSNYAIPITTGPCYACTNAPDTKNIPNFELYGYGYHYSETDKKLYTRNADFSEPSYCGVDMCTDTSEPESVMPDGTTWVPMPATNSTDPTRYECKQINVSCGCVNRNLVCQNTTTGTTSTSTTILGHQKCALKAFCSATYQDTNKGTVTFGAYNKLGNITYSPAEHPVVVEEIPPEGINITRTLIDSYDNLQSSASCSLEYGAGVSTNSKINSLFVNPRVVVQGSVCRFGWKTENMSTCTIDGLTVNTNALAGDSNSYSLPATGEKNITKTLRCVGIVESGPAPIFSTTTTCYVNPKLKED